MGENGGRTLLVAGNWKMNTSVAEGIELARAVCARVMPSAIEVAVLPPFTHLWPVHDVLAGTAIRLGAQDCFWEAKGAFTGEVSPRTLKDVCDMVLVGHSERRRLLGEADDEVGRKLRAALATGLRVIVAVGEILDERERGQAEAVVRRQLDAALEGVTAADLERCVIAYEPVWAIGTGVNATPTDAQAMCAEIRRHVSGLAGPQAADRIQILYGGSMTADNAAELFAEPDVDGGLIGGASLKADQFAAIAAAAEAAGNRSGRPA